MDEQSPGLNHTRASLTQTALHIHDFHMEGRYGHGDSDDRHSNSSVNATAGNSTRPNSRSPERSSHDDLYWNHNSSGCHTDNISPPQEELGHHDVAQPAASGTDTSSRIGTQFVMRTGLKHGGSSTQQPESPGC